MTVIPIRFLAGVPCPLRNLDAGGQSAVLISPEVLVPDAEGDLAWPGTKQECQQTQGVTYPGNVDGNSIAQCLEYAASVASGEREQRRLNVVCDNAMEQKQLEQIIVACQHVGALYPDISISVIGPQVAGALILKPLEFGITVACRPVAEVLMGVTLILQGGPHSVPVCYVSTLGLGPLVVGIHEGTSIESSISVIRGCQLVLEYLGEDLASDLLIKATEEVLLEGQVFLGSPEPQRCSDLSESAFTFATLPGMCYNSPARGHIGL